MEWLSDVLRNGIILYVLFVVVRAFRPIVEPITESEEIPEE